MPESARSSDSNTDAKARGIGDGNHGITNESRGIGNKLGIPPQTMKSSDKDDAASSKIKESDSTNFELPKNIPLNPTNGGRCITPNLLHEADIILSTTNANISKLIRIGTQSVISHTILYIGYNMVVEAIWDKVVKRDINEALKDATVAVAFRYPTINANDSNKIVEYAINCEGKPYNFKWGLINQALFRLNLMAYCLDKSNPMYEKCKEWMGKVWLGKQVDSTFYCSELVLMAYQVAGFPLTSKPPNWSTPEEIAQLSFKDGILGYVGHLKF